MPKQARTAEQQQTFDTLVRGIEELRPLPAIAANIVQMSEGSQFSAQDLARVVSTDQALTLTILRLSNSPLYGLPHRITTVLDALVLLGFREVKKTALAACMMRDGDATTHFDYRIFWVYSLVVGMLGETLAKAEGGDPNEAFTAGVLHNIGRLALDQYQPHFLGTVAGRAREEDRALAEVQLSLLGFTDAELGGTLARRWKFPEPLCEAVEHHVARLGDLPSRTGPAAFVLRARRYARANGMTDGLDIRSKLSPDREWLGPPISTELKRVGGFDGVLERAESFLNQALRALSVA
jgi:HD-like signal output (HDOD) protein